MSPDLSLRFPPSRFLPATIKRMQKWEEKKIISHLALGFFFCSSGKVHSGKNVKIEFPTTVLLLFLGENEIEFFLKKNGDNRIFFHVFITRDPSANRTIFPPVTPKRNPLWANNGLVGQKKTEPPP